MAGEEGGEGEGLGGGFLRGFFLKGFVIMVLTLRLTFFNMVQNEQIVGIYGSDCQLRQVLGSSSVITSKCVYLFNTDTEWR